MASSGGLAEPAGVVPQVGGGDAPQPQTELLPGTVAVVNPARLSDGSPLSQPGHLQQWAASAEGQLSNTFYPSHPH